MAKLYKVDGSIETIKLPKDDQLPAMQAAVGGLIELVGADGEKDDFMRLTKRRIL